MQKEISTIRKALIWDGEVSLAVLDTTALVNEAISRHGLSPVAAAALGRTLTATAYLCSWLKDEESSLSVSIVSGDRDLLQLATDEILIRIPKTKATGTEIEDYYAKEVQERYQVTPTQFIDVKALMGDASDNIPGVPGIGEKTATKIIAQYGSIEEAYAHVDEITPNKARTALSEHYDMAQMSKTLATIDLAVPFELKMEDARIENLYTMEALELCRRLEFKNLLGRFQNVEEPAKEKRAELARITELARAEELFAQLCGQAFAFQLVFSAGVCSAGNGAWAWVSSPPS